MGKTLFITGHPGSGRTTILHKVVKKLGAQAVGFYTEEIFGPGGRKGLELVTLTGERTVITHKDFRNPKMPRMGRYGVDVAALDRVGVNIIQQAMTSNKILILDEIGKATMFSRRFQESLLAAILGPTLIFGTIMFKSHPEVDVFKSLAPVELWEITKINRRKLHQEALQWIEQQR